MSLRRKPPAHENHERWLVSYADFITLLFAFFVVMFASSQTDKARARQVSEAVQKALDNGSTSGLPPAIAKILGGTVDEVGIGNAQMKGPGGAEKIDKTSPDVLELIPSLQRLNRDLEDELAKGKLEVRLDARGLVVSLRSSAFFPSGTDAVAPDMYPTLAKLADVVHDLPNAIQLEGHTDSVPIHNARFASNWDLSSARAIAVLRLLCDQYHLPPARFSVVGRADTLPVDTNDTDAGRQRNRRVDLVIMSINGVKQNPSPQPNSPASADARSPR